MITEQTLHTQILNDFNGEPSFVVLPVNEYKELIEDYNDLAIIAERRNENKISLDELKSKLNYNE